MNITLNCFRGRDGTPMKPRRDLVIETFWFFKKFDFVFRGKFLMTLCYMIGTTFTAFLLTLINLKFIKPHQCILLLFLLKINGLSQEIVYKTIRHTLYIV